MAGIPQKVGRAIGTEHFRVYQSPAISRREDASMRNAIRKSLRESAKKQEVSQ